MNTMTDPREWCACRSTYLLIYIRVLWSIPELHDTHVVSRTHFAPCSSYEKEKMISFFFFSFSDFFCIFFISKSIDKLGKSHRLIAVSTFHIYIYIKNATAVFRSNRFFLNLSDSRQYLIRVFIDARFTYDVYLRSKDQ